MAGIKGALSKGLENAMDKMPPELFAAIGELVARWGYLHFQMGVIVREVAGIKDKKTGRVLTLGPELGVLVGQLYTMTKTDHWIQDSALRTDIKDLAADVRTASDDRNNYAHGVIGFGEKPDTFVRFLMHKTDHRIDPQEEEITVDLLRPKIAEAAELWRRAQEITLRLKALPRKRT